MRLLYQIDIYKNNFFFEGIYKNNLVTNRY